MGFFSDSLADDDAKIEVSLTLNTFDLNVNFIATVLECRLSAAAKTHLNVLLTWVGNLIRRSVIAS